MILLILLASLQPQEPLDRAGAAMDEWKICTARSVARYARASKEPAGTVAEAAIGACSLEFRQVENATYDFFGWGARATADEELRKLKDEWRPRLIAGVLNARSSARPKNTR